MATWIARAFCLLVTVPLAVEASRRRQPTTIVLCIDDHGTLHNKHNHAECTTEVARAQYDNQINKTGWAFLEVETLDASTPDFLQAYAAGYAEGQATKELIAMHLENTVTGYCDNRTEYCQRLAAFLLKNLLWMQSQIVENPGNAYWRQINFTLNQLYGLIDGYENSIGYSQSSDDLTIHPIFMSQLAGDIEDLELKFGSPGHLRRRPIGSGHCSALVKLTSNTSGLQDLLFSHVTWTGYNSMLRLQKRYSFKLDEHAYPGRTVTLSGYPGTLASNDDFVLTSAGLAVFETTISNYNKRLFDWITPNTVPCWMRSQIAHRTANTGIEWAMIFKKFNSGTYNNQWTIVDYKQFFTGRENLSGLIVVVEQLPGMIEFEDITNLLIRQSYWPSYNVPYFQRIFVESATPAFVAKYGDWFTYERNPRARIFARDHAKVVDMASLQQLMRSNDFQHDPLSRCNCTPPYSGENAISCRSDLNPPNGTYPFSALGFRNHGATDMKATNSQLMRQLQFSAISGPTYDPLPIFNWRSSPFANSVSHIGQPETFRFAPVIHKWSNQPAIF